MEAINSILNALYVSEPKYNYDIVCENNNETEYYNYKIKDKSYIKKIDEFNKYMEKYLKIYGRSKYEKDNYFNSIIIQYILLFIFLQKQR